MKFPPLPPLPLDIIDEQFRRGQHFYIDAGDRRRHMAVFGVTGGGKTTLLHNMAGWDMHHGVGLCVIDPHGDVIDDILKIVPPSRTNDIIIFDPLDPTHTLGLNIFEKVPPDMQPLVVSTFVAALKAQWEEISWGPRLERILRNAAYVLMDQPEPVALPALPRLLYDAKYRERALSFVTNRQVREFFTEEFDKWKPLERAEAISAVLNKLDTFLANPYLLSILGQTRSSFDFQWIMDTGKILLCNFRKGLLGDIESEALSSFVVTKLAMAAQGRQTIPKELRRPFFLHIDEARTIRGASLETILNESRKFGLFLALYAQSPQQYSEKLRSAVFTSAEHLITFRAGIEDAEFFKKQMVLDNPASKIQEMENYKMIVRATASTTVIDPETGEEKEVGKPLPPREVVAHPPFTAAGVAIPERVLATSRQRYGRERSRVAHQLATA